MKRRSPRDRSLVMEATLHTLRHLTILGRWVCLALLALYACSGIRTVGPQQVGLVLRFGQLQPRVHSPGLLLALPPPFDEVRLIDTGTEQLLPLEAWRVEGPRVEHAVQIRQYTDAEVREHLMKSGGNMPPAARLVAAGNFLDPTRDGYSMTGDWNIVQGEFGLRYRIVDPVAFLRAGDEATLLLAQATRRALTLQLSRSPIDGVLSDGREKLGRAVVEEVAGQARQLGLGVQPTALEIRALTPPRQVIASFEDVTNARLFARTLVENAHEYRAKTLTGAAGQAAAMRQRAAAYAQELIASAKGEAQAFVEYRTEFMRQPQLAADRLYTETLGYIMREVQATTLLPGGARPPSFLLEPAPDNTR